MKYRFDIDSDCAYITFNDLPHAYSKEIDDARFVDYAEDGTVVGVELLYVSNGVDVSGLPYESEISKTLEKHRIKVSV
jgi:uncharacterized protein YuzE